MTKEKDKKASKKEDKKVEQLEQQLEALQNEKEEMFEKLQRVGAEFANYQKRVPRQISDAISYEKEKIIKSLLPALDNFEHTLQKSQSVTNVEDVLKGVKIIYDQMLDILKSHEVMQIKALGEGFDPSRHEAMLQRSEEDKEDNTVLEEFQTGYTLNGRVIRPGKVVVNKLQPAKTDEPPVEEDSEESENNEKQEQ